MALPNSRNTTYTPDAPVKSEDLNAIQDSVIGLSTRWIQRPAIGPTSLEAGNALFASNGYTILAASSTTRIRIEFDVSPGMRIKQCKARARADAGAMTIEFMYWDGTGSGADGEQVIATLTPGAGALALTQYLSGALDFPIGTDGSVFALVTMNTMDPDQRISMVGILVEGAPV